MTVDAHPSHHLLKYAALILAIVLILAWLLGLAHHHTRTAPVQPHPVAAAPVPHPAALAAAHPASAKTAAAAAALPVGPITLPAQPAPANLAARHAQIGIASVPSDGGQWVTVGAVAVSAPTASFTTKAPAALSAVAPSDGDEGITWRGWFQAPRAGTYTIAAQVAGAQMEPLTVTVDGIAPPIIKMQRTCGLFGTCPAAPTTAAGVVALAKGWHEITARGTVAAAAPCSVTLYMRAPGSDAPTAIVPAWPLSNGKAGGP